MIRATFSADTRTIDLRLPKGWHELTQEELAAVYHCIELYQDEDVRYHILRLLGNMAVGLPDAYNGRNNVAILAETDGQMTSHIVYLTPEMMAEWLEDLNWIAEPGDVPVRLETLGGAKAVDAQFHGVTFKTYYMVENYYQGFIMSQNTGAIAMLEKLLYPGIDIDGEIGPARIMNVVNWLAQLKRVFAANFKNFFKPAVGDSGEEPDMLEIMNNEIRALTGGDITKEEIINNTDCWRALTELDFKAKEAEEFRRQQAKLKK